MAEITNRAEAVDPSVPANSESGGFLRRLYKALPFSTLYYAQGLPYSIVRQMSVVYFKTQGVSLKSLGLVALYGVPWTFKFLWSPLVDLISTKRRWVVAMEFLLTVVIGVVALFIRAHAGITAVAVVFLVVAFVSATHDIATDGFYLEALDKNEQARYSGWVVAAYRLAMLTGGGFLISLTGSMSWAGVFGVGAALFAAITAWHAYILPRPPSAREKKAGPSPRDMIEGFKTFLQLPGITVAILFIVFFKLGDALMFGMSTPFILQRMDESHIAVSRFGLISSFGLVAAIVSSIAGGWFISRFNLKKGLWIFGFIQNVSIPVYALVALMPRAGLASLGCALVVEQIAAGLGTAAYSNFLMRQIDPKFRATHYAIATGMMALTNMLGGVISGFGAQKYGFAVFFMLAFAASVPGIVLIPFVARRPECA